MTQQDLLQELEAQVRTCTICQLSKSRTIAVPGEGSLTPEVMFIGEGPGYNEDQQGRPFVGPAGRLLDELLNSIGMSRQDVYITNMVKCRPPNNRDPLPGEIEACRPYLDRQLEILDPKVIVTLGRYSLVKFFPDESISKARGKPKKWNNHTVFPVYHPAAALRQSRLRDVLEEDFKILSQLVKETARPSQKDQKDQEDEGPVGPQQLNMF